MRGGLQGFFSGRLRLSVVMAAMFGGLAVPAAASADTYYASPDGTVFFCSESQPCSIEVAVNLKIDDDDEILLAPGTYVTSTTLEIVVGNNGNTIRPRDPGTRPVIQSTAGIALQLSGSNSTVRGIEIQHNAGPSPALFVLGGSRVQNVISTSNGDTPCQIGANTRLIDTICHATAPAGRALRMSFSGGTGTGYVRNATLISDDGVGAYVAGTSSGAPILDVASSIIQGDGNDIQAVATGMGTAEVNLAASNYETTTHDPAASVTTPGTNGNQMADPIFTGPTYEQAEGSPTINAGIDDIETGDTDVYGDVRPQGSANDIGADEFPQVNPPPADGTPPETTITKAPKKKTKSRTAKFTFASSESGSTFECQVDKKPFAPCDASLKLKKLKRKGHKLAVRATDQFGNTDTTPATHKWKVKKKRKK